MLRISPDQMTIVERDLLARQKSEILLALGEEFPVETSRLDELSLARFVQQIMTACRNVWIDEASLIQRVARAAFIVEHVRPDKTRQRYFGRVLASEEAAEARVQFIEENLL